MRQNNTEFKNDLSKSTWEQNCKYGEEKTINDMHLRVAKHIALPEKNYDEWVDKFLMVMDNFAFVPGGRITSNAGTGLEGNTLINCFVSGPGGTDQDSMEGILRELRHQALILKSEGGYGFCADFLRPRGGVISGIGNQTPGSVKFLECWDKQSDVITAGSGKKRKTNKEKIKIRKGAQMVTLSCWHPDIIEFIEAKKSPGRLTRFNMSVLCTDEFMNAIKSHLPWKLVFPNYLKYPAEYREHWDGNIDKWKDLLNKDDCMEIYYEFGDANELWDIIMQNAYNRNEPGVLFIDTINKWNNLYYCENISATNPCVTEGTLVNTPFGLIKVEDIIKGGLICTTIGKEEVSKIEKNIDIPVFKVKFSDGGEQTVTASHQYQVVVGKSKIIQYKKLSDISVGDKVRVESCKFNNENYIGYEYCEGLKTGILLGDGCYTQDRINKKILKIATNIEDSEYNALVKKLFGEHFFNKDDISKDSKSMSMMMRIEAVNIKEMGLTPSYSYQKTIMPERIDSYSFAIGLLDGLLATDGNINLASNHPQIRFCTSSKQLAQTIRNILLYFGCHGFVSARTCKGGIINGREIKRKHVNYQVIISGESARNFCRHSKMYIHPCKRRLLKKCMTDYRLTGNRWCAEVKEIREAGTATVYDLKCDDSDTWITGGYVQRGCGEQVLPVGGCCLLGSINLTQFINFEKKDWDYPKLREYIPIIVRMMDNVNDLTYVPLPEQTIEIRNKRRIGLGVLGYASSLMLLKLRYGSKRSLEITEKLMKFIMNEAYSASALLAKEKGAFLEYRGQIYENGLFIQKLNKKTKRLIEKYGMRNSHLLSIQPTANSSILANNVSTGLEPIFSHSCIRTIVQPHGPDGLDMPKNIDWNNKKYEGDGWEWKTEGDEHLLATKFNNEVWKIYQDRGITKEYVSEDYAVSLLKEQDGWNKKAKWAVTIADLSIDDHIKTMEIFSKYIDSAMSKTVNLPSDYSYEDFKSLYMKIYDTGTIKGCTVYRKGTTASVLSDKSILDSTFFPKNIVKVAAPQRPKTLPCDIHRLEYKGKKWLVFVGLLNNEPYEVFALRQKKIQLPRKLKDGLLTKEKGYNLECEDDFILEDITDLFESDEEEAITRLISTALRHGVDIEFVIDQLLKSSGTVFSFNKVIARTLKKYLSKNLKIIKCRFCGSKKMMMLDGCFQCGDCGKGLCD